ncbi:MAG: hypothetical protein FWG62_02660, partial [Proteobacteria bacterium]|nr:hypothetical protein [Pseudomonadota bacterium]
MTTDEQNEKNEKNPPVRKAKTGAWWKSVFKEKKAQSEALEQDFAAKAADPASEREPGWKATPLPAKPELRAASTDAAVTAQNASTNTTESAAPVPTLAREEAPELEPTKAVDQAVGAADQAAEAATPATASQDGEAAPAKKRRSRRGGRRRSKQTAA